MKSLLIVLLFFSIQSHAFNSVLETGDLLEEGQYSGMVFSEFLLDDESGVNFTGRFDTWLTEELNSQVYLGVGKIDFFVSGLVKWVPFPDFDDQPALGIKIGPEYAREDSKNFLNFKLSPFASKKFMTDIGEITPFASLPISVRSIEGETVIPVHLALGAEWMLPDLNQLSLLSEVGIDLNKSSTYWTFAAKLEMDDTNGIQLK